MKKSIAFVLALMAISSVANAQWFSGEKITGNGNVITKVVTTSDYEKILVSGFFDVDLVSGNEGKITINGEENLLEFLKIEVVDKALKIGTEKGKNLKTSLGKKIQITVPFETLEEVSLSGSGDVNSKNSIKANQFTTNLSGSGDIRINVDAKAVTAKITGSGDVVLKGKSESFVCSITGSGDLSAFELESNNVDSSVTGSGNCKVFCKESLQARVTGSGDINYKGNPKKKDTKTTGSGSITKS